jgi:flagellar hook assembly protein FlgD
LPSAQKVKLRIFNTAGQLIRTLVDNEYRSGEHSVRWDGRDSVGQLVASGVYFYELQTGVHIETKKLVLIR